MEQQGSRGTTFLHLLHPFCIRVMLQRLGPQTLWAEAYFLVSWSCQEVLQKGMDKDIHLPGSAPALQEHPSCTGLP